MRSVDLEKSRKPDNVQVLKQIQRTPEGIREFLYSLAEDAANGTKDYKYINAGVGAVNAWTKHLRVVFEVAGPKAAKLLLTSSMEGELK